MAFRLPEQEEREIRETCELFDPNKTGKLSRDDIAKVTRSTGLNPTEKELLDMFQTIDSEGMEGIGKIDVNEFIDYYTRKLYKPENTEEEEANDAFKVFDRHGEGYIELHDFKKIMTNIGEDTFSDVEFRQQILRDIKPDVEGKVDYLDFVKWMNQKI